ncbi:hypothetical protein [Streptomyces purpureus]|uniref:hypothetical protein n=1 Tax=Streptomyces purpureus TaxID=1951 RepID=UPI00036EFD75|nr:hypothetical protein [Streptomyces purpureus]
MDDETIVKSAMDRTTDDLPPLPDLVPLAIRQGRRRVARARLAVVAGSFAVVTATALGLTLLPGTASQVPIPAAPPSPSPSAYRTPVTLEPTPGQQPPARVPDAERQRLADFQQRAAALLDELLPDSVTDVRPVADHVRQYRITAGGRTFPLFLSVAPADDEPQPCPSVQDKRLTCSMVDLGGGRTARALKMMTDGPDTYGYEVGLRHGRSRASLSVTAAEPTKTQPAVSSPVTTEALLTVVRDRRFTDLLTYADEHPVQKKDTSVVGG